MLPETASSMQDRPVQRTARYVPDPETSDRADIRRLVASVFTIERELVPEDNAAVEVATRDLLLMVGPRARLLVSYQGRLTAPSETAYAQLDAAFAPHGWLPIFRERDDQQFIHVVEGRVQPQPRSIWVNVVLFVLTLICVLIVGTAIAQGEASLTNEALADQIGNNLIPNLWRGLPYALALLGILGAHELGHYFAGRYHMLSVTLPYFIPAPPIISPIGTAGAFIQLREPIRNRKVLLDVGAAGPLVGLVVCIPILIIGLATSPVGPVEGVGLVEGNSLLYALAKTAVFGRFVPAGDVDVTLNQLAQAGWTGLLVTALNLIPLGQLDGGHILFSLIGNNARRLYLPILGAVVLLTIFVSESWLFWLVLLFLFGRVYAAPLDLITPLDKRRRFIAILSLVVFVVTFVPVPFSFRDVGGTTLPQDTVYALLPLALVLWRLRKVHLRLG